MFLVVELVAQDDLQGGEGLGDTRTRRERVEPQDHVVYQLDEDHLGHLFERKGVEDAAPPLLDYPDASLDFGHVFFGCGGIDVEARHQRPEFFKLVVHQYGTNHESSASVQLSDLIDTRGERFCGPGW